VSISLKRYWVWLPGRVDDSRKEEGRALYVQIQLPDHGRVERWIRDGGIGRKMESILGVTQPETTYFGSVDGNRSGYLVINIDEASEISAKLEPLFQELGATVECSPVMIPEELRTAIQVLQ